MRHVRLEVDGASILVYPQPFTASYCKCSALGRMHRDLGEVLKLCASSDSGMELLTFFYVGHEAYGGKCIFHRAQEDRKQSLTCDQELKWALRPNWSLRSGIQEGACGEALRLRPKANPDDVRPVQKSFGSLQQSWHCKKINVDIGSARSYRTISSWQVRLWGWSPILFWWRRIGVCLLSCLPQNLPGSRPIEEHGFVKALPWCNSKAHQLHFHLRLNQPRLIEWIRTLEVHAGATNLNTDFGRLRSCLSSRNDALTNAVKNPFRGLWPRYPVLRVSIAYWPGPQLVEPRDAKQVSTPSRQALFPGPSGKPCHVPIRTPHTGTWVAKFRKLRLPCRPIHAVAAEGPGVLPSSLAHTPPPSICWKRETRAPRAVLRLLTRRDLHPRRKASYRIALQAHSTQRLASRRIVIPGLLGEATPG